VRKDYRVAKALAKRGCHPWLVPVLSVTEARSDLQALARRRHGEDRVEGGAGQVRHGLLLLPNPAPE
jgi:hypothetical protein